MYTGYQHHAAANLQQSESFSVNVPPERATALNIQPDISVHGTSGPLEVTYPRFLYNQSSMPPRSDLRFDPNRFQQISFEPSPT